MRYISKYIFKKKGHAIIKKFIHDHWDKETGCYFNLNYNELKRNKSFERQLIKEQHGFCCYCMRRLNDKEITLEHIIPQKIKKNNLESDVKYYAQFGRLKRRYVKYMESIPKDRKLKLPPYPHSMAYENIVASCTGKIYNEGKQYTLHQCCNNFRGNKRIIPCFFTPEIEIDVKYRTDGTIDCPERYDDTIKKLNLEHRSLVFIRKIWASIVKANITIRDVQNAKKDELLRGDIISDINIKRDERKQLENAIYWDLLNEFCWFYEYYHKKLR